MKKLFAILSLAVVMSYAQAQIKNPTNTPAKEITVKPGDTKPEATMPAVKHVQQTNSPAATSEYKTAIGVKFLYGFSITAKHFLKENHALEGIFNYRGFNGLGSQFGATIAYEYHQPVNGVAGLKWYVGGGGHLQHFSFDDNNVDATTLFGVAGVLGLEYKFSSIPLAISADWQPIYILNENAGFSAENGGIGIKYTF